MKKLGLSLAGAGVAAVFALAAQVAHAETIICPTPGDDGGGVYQEEVGGEPCPQPTGSYTPLEFTAQTADNVPVEVITTVEDGDEILAPGTITEVTVEFDDVMAYLKDNEEEALALAAAQGIRPSSVMKAGRPASAKLNAAEVKLVAENLYGTMQSRTSTGRSNPAGQNTTRRESRAEAVGRAIGGFVRSAFSMRIGFVRTAEHRVDGSVSYRTEFQIEVNPQDD